MQCSNITTGISPTKRLQHETTTAFRDYRRRSPHAGHQEVDMISQHHADALAQAWISAWNAHDLDAVMALYHDDTEYISPIAARLLEREDGRIQGATELREYLAKGLLRYPDLRLELLHVLPGVQTVTLVYRSIQNL